MSFATVPNGSHRSSLLAALALWALIAAAVLLRPPVNIISWDSFGYHLYLPATLLHGDPGISDPSWVHAANAAYGSTGTLYQLSELPNGRWVNKYPMGMALLWSPFFAAGHLAAIITGAPRDGFSKPYQWALIAAGLGYALIGLLVLRKALLRFFSEEVAIAVLVLLVLGTNLYHQATVGVGMPHIVLFALGAGVLWRTIRWREASRARDALLIGLLLGLMTVARPSEAVWALVPLLAGLADASGWRAFLHAQWARRRHFLLMASAALTICLPQILYWKWMTGRWLYMSYNNPGEGFEFLHPYTWEALFSFRKGWLVYTPLMAAALLGFIPLWRAGHPWRWALAAFVAINLWVVTSWSCWWYADSFGQRALVQSYALLAVPLGAALQWLGEQRARLRWGLPLLLAFVALNLFQTWQINRGILHTSRMTWPAYAAAWMKTARPEGLDRLLLVDRSYTGAQALPDAASYIRKGVVELPLDEQEGGDGVVLSPERAYSPAWRCAWERLTGSDHIWIEVACRFQRPPDGAVPHAALVATFEHGGHSYGYHAVDADLADVAPGEWRTVRLWMLSPEVRRPTDELLTYCWLRDTLPVRVADLSVHAHEPRP